MPSLNDIKQRIKSIQNTQKITQAMRMVAAAKVKKAEKKVKESRPYTKAITEAFIKVRNSMPDIQASSQTYKKAIDNYPALLEQRDVKTVGILVITSDKGLAGAYNANIIRKTIARVKELKSEGKQAKLFIVGTKGVAALTREYKGSDVEIVKFYTKLPAIPTPGGANIIAEDVAEAYVDKKIDKIEVMTTRFVSMLSFKPEQWNILPAENNKKAVEKAELKAETVYSPSPEAVLQKIVPLYISNIIFQAMIEVAASELAARMSAMANATNNASEMIQQLTVSYNKARQAAITQEISEIVGGANALQG